MLCGKVRLNLKTELTAHNMSAASHLLEFAMKLSAFLICWAALLFTPVSLKGMEAEPITAASQAYRFDISPGPLSDALAAFQAVTGMKVSVAANILQNLTSPGVSGIHSAEAALAQLLAGTGLTARLTATHTFSIEVWISPENVEVTGQNEPYRAEGSSTATKTLTPLRDIPQTVNVVTRELLIDQGAQSLAQAMKNVPGVSVAQGEGNRDQLVVRGINTSSDFFVNGIRDDQERFRDLYNVDSIEVLQGPAAVLFGRGGGGGIVNLVTRGPLSTSASDVGLELGDDDHKRGTLHVGIPLGSSTAFRVSAMGENSGSFRDGYFLHRYGVNPTLGVVLGNETRLTVGYEHLYDRRLADRGIPSASGRPAQVGAHQFFGSLDQNFAKSTVDAASATLEHRFSRNLAFRNNTLVGSYDKFYQNVYAGTAVNAAGTLTLSAYNHANDRTNTFNQSDFIYNADVAGTGHTILFGAELGHQFQDEIRITPANITNVPVGDSLRNADFSTAPVIVDRHATSTIVAGYLQDQITLNAKWKAVVGARTDRFTVQIDDRRPGASDLSRTDVETSPRAGVIFQPSDTASVYGSFSYTFLPSGQTLGLAANTVQLKPENAKNYEIGSKVDLLNRRLNVAAALFRLDRNNVKNTDPNNPALLVLTGQQRTDGAVFSVAGNVTRRLKVYAGYANLNARVIKDTAAAPAGRRVGLVPRSQATVWSSCELSKHWEVAGGVVSQTRMFASFSNQVELPGFTRVDAALFYRAGRYRIALNSENLFNTRYHPTAHNDNNISPGAPRNLQLSLRAAF
jgi:catecholate siderophore receptor